MNLFEVIKNSEKEDGCRQCHISIFRLCSIAQARFGEVRFSEQETDLERKSLTFIYITQTFSTGNSWGSICLLLVLSYSLRILGTYSNNVISLFLRTGLNFDLFKTWLVVQVKIKRHSSTRAIKNCWVKKSELIVEGFENTIILFTARPCVIWVAFAMKCLAFILIHL